MIFIIHFYVWISTSIMNLSNYLSRCVRRLLKIYAVYCLQSTPQGLCHVNLDVTIPRSTSWIYTSVQVFVDQIPLFHPSYRVFPSTALFRPDSSNRDLYRPIDSYALFIIIARVFAFKQTQKIQNRPWTSVCLASSYVQICSRSTPVTSVAVLSDVAAVPSIRVHLPLPLLFHRAEEVIKISMEPKPCA